MEQELVKVLAPIIGTVISVLVTWGLAELSRYIRAKTKSESARLAMESFTSIVRTVVSETGQTFQAAASDGKLTAEEMRIMKERAVARVKELVPPEVEKNAAFLVADLNEYINARIEREVAKGKINNNG